jgi:outer membrane protein assembly factor BamE (lipoprotein component of BamABCDE complex)
MMTAASFYSIPVGATKEEVVSQAGSPSRIVNKGGGVQEYEYVERLRAGARTLQESRYIFTLQDDKVTAKRVERSSPSPAAFENDSYNMQTTQNGPSSF